jgi:FixJ family two-component response regulator
MAGTGKLNLILGTPPRILIVDNDERASDIYKELVKHWGYLPVVAQGSGNDLLDDARKKARKYRCHLALVDMRLIDDSDEDDTSGLDLIEQIKPAACIVVSGHGKVSIAMKSVQEKGAASFIGKEDGPLAIKKAIETEIQKRSACARKLKIASINLLYPVPRTLFDPNISVEYHDQIADALALLFPEAHSLRIEKLLSGNSETGMLTAPRPRSIVLKIYEDDFQPVIVKFARPHKIEKEVRLFKKYIDRRLVGAFRPTLDGYTVLWDIGAIKLSYVGNITQTFPHFFQTQPIEKIERTLEHFFMHTWAEHYKKARKASEISLFELYCSVWDKDWYQRVLSFKPLVPAEEMGNELWSRLGVKDPLHWLIENVASNDRKKDLSWVKETRVAITHGDLHADNLLVDDSDHAWVVDFERSGEGHALQDFVELESDLINRIVGSRDDIPSFYALCVTVCSMCEIGDNTLLENQSLTWDEETLKLLKTIDVIRKLACKCSKIMDAREYLLCLFFNTVFRATITQAQTQEKSQKRAFMLASILCSRLERWNDPWPPQIWKDLLTGR